MIRGRAGQARNAIVFLLVDTSDGEGVFEKQWVRHDCDDVAGESNNSANSNSI